MSVVVTDDQGAVLHRQSARQPADGGWSRWRHLPSDERKLATHPVAQVAILRQRIRNALRVSGIRRLRSRHLWSTIQVQLLFRLFNYELSPITCLFFYGLVR